ncbi:RES family NAD+ phosphorylase [Noviherbaspirillum saxi]|uniref:RES domain-containing protein n=1 Tax=Noviherbaspirillum saxi TaxID=2320863 RepID=A0A3A3FXG4_9BURK|nr:RES family NAD+ phosphorylase [Noviherbaspirillum saxi]RJF99368.1 RES domain-containing protein [Noviherbaspirillum saxi]
MSVTYPVTNIEWHPAFRIIPTRFPTINLFDRVASPKDFDALYALEAMTNDRLRDELGEIQLVPRDERLYGPGCGPIMAAFTHLNPAGSRFSDGSYGVFYAAREKQTAIAETTYHQGRFLASTSEAPIQLQMRVYHVEVSGAMHDLRTVGLDDPIYSLDVYAASQALGKRLRSEGADGISYRSVRFERGECIAAFRTRVLANCRHGSQMLYQWDGEKFSGVFEKVM